MICIDEVNPCINICIDIKSYSFFSFEVKATHLSLFMGNSRSAAAFADESEYKYEPPGPNDSRSPCPALNALANHGYISRDGKNIPPDILQRVLQVHSFVLFE
jgi:hypothetical protein